MKRTSLVVAGFSAMIALGLIGYGCTSGDNVSGTGGSNGSGSGGQTTGGGTGGQTTGGGTGGSASGSGGSASGAGGSASGAGGSASGAGGSASGTGGAAAGVGGATGGLLTCASTLKDKAACLSTDVSCTKNCGVNASGASQPRATKPCACIASTVTPPMAWDCTNAGPCAYPPAFDKTCFSLTPAPAACPTTLITTGTTTCTNTAGATCGPVCGSATVNSYQDSSMAAKMGYCACINGVWQCASAKEWPM